MRSRKLVTFTLSFRPRDCGRGIRFSSARLALVTLGVWLLAASLPAILLAQPPQVDKEAFRRISDRLICQCGCNYGLSHCPHLECPSAPVLRASIREKVAGGLSEQAVLDAMVAEYGPAVLAAPPAEGFNLSAWVMPFLALLAGLLVVQQVLRRWRARPAVVAADPEMVERYQKTIEREMERLEE